MNKEGNSMKTYQNPIAKEDEGNTDLFSNAIKNNDCTWILDDNISHSLEYTLNKRSGYENPIKKEIGRAPHYVPGRLYNRKDGERIYVCHICCEYGQELFKLCTKLNEWVELQGLEVDVYFFGQKKDPVYGVYISGTALVVYHRPGVVVKINKS